MFSWPRVGIFATGRRDRLLAGLGAVLVAGACASATSTVAAVRIKDGVIACWNDQAKQIFSRSLDGSAARQLTFPPGQSAQPAFSPDGRTIAYLHVEQEQGAAIWTMDPDGSNRRLIASSSDDPSGPRMVA